MADIIDLFGSGKGNEEEVEEGTTVEFAKEFVDTIVQSMTAELEMKNMILNSSLDMYEQAVKEAGAKNGETTRNDIAEFLTRPVLFTMTHAVNGVIPLMEEDFGDKKTILGIRTCTEDTEEDEDFPKDLIPGGIGIVMHTSIEPFALLIEGDSILEYAGDDGWVESEMDPESFVTSQPSFTKMQQEILDRNDAASELLLLVTKDGREEIPDEVLTEIMIHYTPLVNLANATSGLTTLMVSGKGDIALAPMDENHFGPLVTIEDGWYCINQYIDPEEIQGDSEKEHVFGFARRVARTRDAYAAERLIRQHEDARRGIKSVVTLPLSLRKLICIKMNNPEAMLADLRKQMSEHDDFTKQEIENAESFANYLAEL